MRVRKNFVVNLLKLLTLKGTWRQHQGEEPLNKWYAQFDWLSETNIDYALPDDGIPEDLHVETLEDDCPEECGLTVDLFSSWINEGRHDCEVAQMLLHLWIHTLSASNHETLHDFFHILPEEYKKDLDATPSSESALVVEHSLPVLWLADKIRRLGKLSFQVAQNDPDSIKKELAQRIYEEVYMVQAYCKTWRSTAGMMKDRGKSIEDELHTRVSDTVYPWPEIKATPTGYREDGRFAKSFPLEFPFGVGDLYQPRIRNDFSTVDWAQRQFQYYDGRCISSLRGNRLTWAIFNEALRETSHSTGCLVHRNVHESILTKAELQTMLNSRSDLVQKISSFGADIPTTPMMWKKEGNHLEWIVRQMSWVPPWINDEREELPIF